MTSVRGGHFILLTRRSRVNDVGGSMPAPILIIDDSQTVRKIVEVALQREGYSGISFSDGLAVLRWLLEPSGSTTK